MEPKVFFVLRFDSSLPDKTVSLTIPHADPALDEAQIASGMAALVANGLIAAKSGKPIAPRDAKRVTRAEIDPLAD